MQLVPPRLPVVKIIAGSVMLFWERRYALLQVLWLPLLLGIAFTISEGLWGPSSWETGSLEQDSRVQTSLLLWALPRVVLWVVFAARSYRVYLFGDKQPVSVAPISWGLRETRLVFAMAGIFFVYATTTLVLVTLIVMFWPGIREFGGGWFVLALIIPPAYLAARLWLAFPALAIDKSEDVFQALTESWNMTRQNGWQVLVLCVLLPLLVGSSLYLLGQLPGIYLIAGSTVWLVIPLEVALVALVYVTLQRSATTTTVDSPESAE